MGKIKRSEFMTFMNTTPSTTATYKLIGDGVQSGKINYNPKVTEETYINQDSANVAVESYGPKMPVEQTAIDTDPVFVYLETLRKVRATLDAAETDIVNVNAWEAGGPTAYPAEKQAVSISFETFGGDGGKAIILSYTINYNGDPVPGTFNASTFAFTPS